MSNEKKKPTLNEKIDITTARLMENGAMLWGDKKPPEVAFILGSGLGGLVNKLEGESRPIDMVTLPYFPHVGAQGHAGKVWLGTIAGKRVLIQQGRGHYYEGNPVEKIVHPIRSYARWGIKALVVTNAARAVNTNYFPGDFMIMTDHNNLFSGVQPLYGPNDKAVGSRSPAMAGVYSNKLANLLIDARDDLKKSSDRTALTFRRGVYAMVPGPCYESKHETSTLHTVGVDAVGMSTIPEVIAARHMGHQNILGLSLITNVAGKTELDHEEVLDVGKKSAAVFEVCMVEFMRQFSSLYLYS